MTLTIEHRIELAAAAHAEGRIIQGSWRRQGDGRELVCALAAFGPDINSVEDCPADLMPPWLAALVPAIDDGIALDQVAWFSGALIERARAWHVLDDAAWDSIRTGFLIAGVRAAIRSAATVHQGDPPPYWAQVEAASEQVCTALQTGEGLAEAEAAARAAARAAEAAAAWAAAEAAAEAAAAWAAEAAARAAARAAAWAAARAAEAAARAAAWAAAWAAARAAEAAARAAAWAAARAAAWKSLAEALFALIDEELAKEPRT